MKCDCCGRKKKLMESFEDVGRGGNICKECSDLLYRIHDAFSEKDADEYNKNVNLVKACFVKGCSNEYKRWFEEDFISRNKL